MSNLLFLGDSTDKAYLPKLKGSVGSSKCFLSLEPIQTWYEVRTYCEKRDIKGVITTSQTLLHKLIPDYVGKKTPSVDNYAGSLFVRDGIEVIIVSPLEQTISVPYGDFLLKRYASKITERARWMQTPTFNWCILTPSNIEHEYNKVSNWELCAFDIETFKEKLAIRCIGFTFASCINGSYVSRTLVLPLDTDFSLVWAAKFLATRSAKIAQNGKYDINYLLRYSIVPNNYVWDTAALMHCWYSELPKDLASLSAFFVRDSMYWKDLADTQDLQQYYLYNGKDTHQTLCAMLGWVREAPDWARKNYLQEFPLQFPCILSEMRGIKRDIPRLKVANEKLTAQIAEENTRLSAELGVRDFNTNSPVQKKQLLKILGCGDLESTDEKNLAKARLRHPLNSRILGQVSSIQKKRKLLSTYLCGGKELNGRILYALNPHGTDTGRLASREHHFWCGLQIQNIPRGKEVKATFVADDGFLWGESDLEQAESRDTAYITGDRNLIAAVDSGRDFHSTNASSFFGIPYNLIYDDTKKETIDRTLRDLAKRVNHGASYLMGYAVLIDTMGEDKIREAQKLLSLPRGWSLREVGEHLLDVFTRTYPAVRIEHPDYVRRTVALNKKLVGATGWTRYCFSDPSRSKSALNAYTAHGPQSLNAMCLNLSYMDVFYKIALPNPHDFRLNAQIHDSILFQYRIGHEHLAQQVKTLMERPIQVTDIKGITRTLTVPAALKCGKQYWSEL